MSNRSTGPRSASRVGRRPLVAALLVVAVLSAGCSDSSTADEDGAASTPASSVTTVPAPASPADVVFRGGPVLTVNDEDEVAEAVAVSDGRIAYVGDEAGVAAHIGPRTEVVEIGGALAPGFVDAHGHFPGTGLSAVGVVNLAPPPVGEVDDIADLQAALAEQVARAEPGAWVLGRGYDDTLLAERRHPTRRDLDAVSTEHPIYAEHNSSHLGVLNSRALEELGIDASTPDPDGGVIRREPGGTEPDGVLEETALDAARQQLFTFTLGQAVTIAEAATRDHLAQGVTTAQSGATTTAIAQGLVGLADAGALDLRVVVWPDEELADAVLAGEVALDADPEVLTVGAVKLIADGSIQGYSAFLSEPYHVAPDGEDDTYRGYARQSADELAEDVARFHEAGWQVAVHGNGDAAIDDILDAFEAAQEADPRPDARPIVVHAQMARDSQLDRMRAIGATPSFFSLHPYYWGDRHRDVFLGPRRAARIDPAASALDRDLRFTIHADAPVVPMEPLRLMWAAVNRRTRSDQVLGEEERISPTRALRATTIDAAWQSFLEDERGSIEVGKLADLVVLSGNPIDDPQSMDRIEARQTWVGGELRYDAAADGDDRFPTD